MHAVGAEPLGKVGIVLDKQASAGRLHRIDQPTGMIFVDGGAVTAQSKTQATSVVAIACASCASSFAEGCAGS